MPDCAPIPCGGAFGSGGFGSVPFGTGTVFGLLEVKAISLNAVRVTYTAPVKTFDRGDITDATNPKNYTLVVWEPFGAVVRLAQFVERVSNKVVIVYFDGTLTPGATYKFVVNPRVENPMGLPIDASPGCGCLLFDAIIPFRYTGPILKERKADLDNPFTTTDEKADAELGTIQIDDKGDYALHSGRPYLRKRIIRRATTALGGFFHLPDYGFSEPLKGKITPDLLRRMQTRAQTQVQQEPDVVSAQVTASLSADSSSVVVLTIKVLQRSGNEETVTVAINVGGA